MAVINNISASLTSFKINDMESNLANVKGIYNTANLLNGGVTYDSKLSQFNNLTYTFKINGLEGHTIKNIIVKSLLLTPTGDLHKGTKFNLTLNTVSTTLNLEASDSVKTILPTAFSWNQQIEGEFEIVYKADNITTEECCYCLQSILINLNDINQAIQITFTGPISQRTPSTIKVATLVLNKDSTEVSFSKDPINVYNRESDNVEGRLYLKQNGIYVDGYCYGTAVVATTEQSGIVKLSKESFNIAEDGGILIPTESGVAATPQLVYNALTSSINYTDKQVEPIKEFINGIDAPLIVKILDENEQKQSLGKELTFSKDFEYTDNKLYISWLEVTNN